jgi:hypothetical protein
MASDIIENQYGKLAKRELERLLEDDEFKVWIPPTARRGFRIAKADAAEPERRLIRGFCTTEDLDRQDEVVVAKGLDFGPFLNFGWFNDNHSPKTADVLGWPTYAKLHPGKGWFVKGELLRGKKAADDVWELAQAIAKSNSPRRLGYSIEGRATKRNKQNHIVEGLVRHVAITNQPVNPSCQLELFAKAFAPISEVEAYRKQPRLGMHRKHVLGFSDVVRVVRSEFPKASEKTVADIARWALTQ